MNHVPKTQTRKILYKHIKFKINVISYFCFKYIKFLKKHLV